MSTMPDGWREWFMTFNLPDMTGEVHIYVDGEYVTRESEQPDHAGCWERREGLRLERETVNADGSKSLYFVPLDPDPATPAPTAPLATLDCPECFDDGPRSDCRVCGGAGAYEVCSGCGERPWVCAGIEACLCTMSGLHAPTEGTDACENCQRRVPMGELEGGICGACYQSTLERIISEEDPGYAAWVREELEFGRAVGWL